MDIDAKPANDEHPGGKRKGQQPYGIAPFVGPAWRGARSVKDKPVGRRLAPFLTRDHTRQRALFWPVIIQSAAVLEAVKARPGNGGVRRHGGATAGLDSFCARRRRKSAVGAEENLRRGRTKERVQART